MVTKYIADEARIVAIGAIVSGFRSSRECVDRLRASGMSWQDIAKPDTSIAIMREVRRQRTDGQRPAIVTKYDPPPIPWRESDWTAVCEGYEPPMPIGRGPTEFQAILDLVWQLEESAHADA